MNYTSNFGLKQPEYGEKAKVDDINYNSEKIDNLIKNDRDMTAPYFDQTKAYVTGELVQLNGVLYKFTADKAAGNWDDSKVVVTNLGKEVAEGSSSVSALEDLSDVEITTPAGGDTLKYDPTSQKWVNGEGSAAVTKEASGNPIELTDAASAPMVKCSTSIDGYQDLHGYDKPWVGGAGKNKLEVTATTQTVSGVTFTVNDDGTIVANGTAASHIIWTFGSMSSLSDNTNYILSGVSGGAANTYRIDIRTATAGVQQTLTDGELTFTKNSSMAVITIRIESGYTINNVKFYPMIRLSTETDSTFAPYSNICPITAYTEGEIEVRGKNIISEIEQNTYNADGTTYVSTKRCRTPIFRLRSGSTYVFSFSTSNTSKNIRVVYQIWANNSYTNNQIIEESQNKTSPFTITPQNDIWISLNFKYTDDSNITPSEITAQGEKGTTPTTYEPYVGTTHTTTFSDSIYQGEVDFVAGEVNEKWKVIDLGDLTWTYASSSSQFRSSKITDIEEPANLTTMPNAICENYETITYQNISSADSAFTVIFASSNDHGKIYVKDSRYTDATAFTSAVSGVKLAYKLATPTTEQVTVTNAPVKSLLGYNHIESSTGDLDIEYITKDFQPIVDLIESSGAETQDILYVAQDMTDTEITIDLTAYDEYIFFANDVLATTQIPQGNSLPKAVVEYIISNNSTFALYGYDDCSCIYTVASNKLTYSSGRGGYKITMIVGIKNGTVTRNVQTRSLPTRSLNLSKSEISEEKKEVDETPIEEEKPVEEKKEEER